MSKFSSQGPVSTSDLEAYAAKKKRFTTEQVAKDLRMPVRRVAATLANRCRHGRKSNIHGDGHGKWRFKEAPATVTSAPRAKKDKSDLPAIPAKVLSQIKAAGVNVVAVFLVQP